MRVAVGMLLKAPGVVCCVCRRVLSYEQVAYQLIGRGSNISAVTPPPTEFCNIFLRVADLTETFCNRGWLIKGRVTATTGVITYEESAEAGRLLLPGVHRRCCAAMSAIRLLPPQVCTYGFRCKVQTIRKGTIRAAPAVRCKPASTGSARRPSSTRRPAAPEGR